MAMSTPLRSSRFGAPNAESATADTANRTHGSAIGTRPASAPTPQPLDITDALSRYSGDRNAAFENILAERNQFCLDNAKLSSENVRIWNLMGRIRKENEALKARTAELEKSLSSASNSSKLPSSASSPAIAAALPASARRRLPQDLDKSASPLSPSRLASRTEHTDLIGSPASTPRSKTLNGDARPQQQSNHDSNIYDSPVSSVDQGPSRSAQSVEAAPGTPQSSIIQQRAAAQAHSLALSRDGLVKGDKIAGSESSEFEAIDQSSTEDEGEGLPRSAPLPPVASRSLTPGQAVQPLAQPTTSTQQQTPARSAEQERSMLAAGPNKGLNEAPVEALPSSTSTKSLVDRLINSDRAARSPSSKKSKDATKKPVLAPRLDSMLLRVASIKIQGTNYRSLDRGKDAISFFITVEILHPPASWGLNSLASGEPAPPTFWTIEKSYSNIVGLDAKQRNKVGKKAAQRLAPLPDKALFKDDAPAKVDQRKALLEIYLQSLMVLDLPDKDEVCTFLCTDVVPSQIRDPASTSKTGFLTKKGQNLGRWVTRYYVLQNSILNYYETQGGAQIGTINIKEAQIGRQQKSATANEQDENAYRHAFLVLEKRPATFEEPAHIARHVLCAESDDERDDWVDVLVRAIAELDAPPVAETPAPPTQAMSAMSLAQTTPFNGRNQDTPLSPSADAAPRRPDRDPNMLSPRPAAFSLDQPRSPSAKTASDLGSKASQPTASNGFPTSPSFRNFGEPRSPVVARVADNYEALASPGGRRESRKGSISAPINGAPIPTGYKFGAKDEISADARKDDKKRFWQGFRSFGANDKNREYRPVFGVPLTESIAVSSIHEGLALPSVVYRCIEYMEKRNAYLEEGLYRLSGSSAVIKTLKDRFNMEGDVDLLAEDQFYDPHAIAGLLKTFLRELPTSVLTRELHMDFMRVHEINDRAERVNELGRLVSQLPLANYSLLRTLCSHLINLIQHAEVNKMTMRNVGIVFSPTLAIGAGIFALFLTEFDSVFETDDNGEPAPKRLETDPSSMGAVDAATAAGDADERGEASTESSSVDHLRKSSKRNSVQYRESQTGRLLGLEGKRLTHDDGVGEDIEDGLPDDALELAEDNRDFWTGDLNQPMQFATPTTTNNGHSDAHDSASNFSHVAQTHSHHPHHVAAQSQVIA